MKNIILLLRFLLTETFIEWALLVCPEETKEEEILALAILKWSQLRMKNIRKDKV